MRYDIYIYIYVIRRLKVRTRVCNLLVSVGTPDGKRPLGRSKHRWMNSTKWVLTFILPGRIFKF